MQNSSSGSGRKYVVPAVERAVLILQLLAQEPDGLTISQIAETLSLHKSTVFTILQTLKLYRLVEASEEAGKYHLGIELFILGSRVVERVNLRSTAYPVLKRLAQNTRLTTHLGILDEGEVVYIEKIEGHGPIKISSAVGRRMSIHSTALGKAMLSQLSEAERYRLIEKKGLSRRTPNTLTSLELLEGELARTRERGYALDDEENEPGIRCLGASIYNHQREIAGAISISGPRDIVSYERIEDLAQAVKEAASEISQALGFVPA